MRFLSILDFCSSLRVEAKRQDQRESNVIFDILNILGQLQQISQIYHTQVRMF